MTSLQGRTNSNNGKAADPAQIDLDEAQAAGLLQMVRRWGHLRLDADADVLARWPHLAKHGPQLHNQIGTLRDSLRRAFGSAGAPVQCPPLTEHEIAALPLSREHQTIFDALRPHIEDIAVEVVSHAVESLRGAA